MCITYVPKPSYVLHKSSINFVSEIMAYMAYNYLYITDIFLEIFINEYK